jgi:hypothetical protein
MFTFTGLSLQIAGAYAFLRCALSRAQATRSSLDRRTDMIVHTDKGGCVRRGLGAAHIRSWMRTRHADSRDVRGPLWRTALEPLRRAAYRHCTAGHCPLGVYRVMSRRARARARRRVR